MSPLWIKCKCPVSEEKFWSADSASKNLLLTWDRVYFKWHASFLHGEQKLFTAGTGEEEDHDTVWFTTSSGIEYPAPGYKCAAEEGDTRVWLHADRAPCRKKLIYSADTDVYHIGLANIDTTSDDIIVQLSNIGKNLKLLHINKFIEALIKLGCQHEEKAISCSYW